MAPTEVPIRKSGRIPASISAWIIPTWIAPRLLPPDNTKAVFTGRRAARPFVGGVGWVTNSSSFLIRKPGSALGAKSLQHHGGV
jgi:hypothetical protein